MISPVLQHRSAHHLVRHLVDSHIVLRGASPAALAALMEPAISICCWLTRFAPELLDLEHLNIAVSAGSPADLADEGRWFQFIPWLLGKPQMTVEVTLMVADASSFGQSMEKLKRSGSHAYVKERKAADIQFAPLGAISNPAGYSLFILSHPDFTGEHLFWFAQRELDAVLGSEKPVAVFAYSGVEYVFDRAAANAYGLNAPAKGIANPFAAEPDGWRGSYAGWLWDLTKCRIPREVTPDHTVFADTTLLVQLLESPLQDLGDSAMMMLGQQIEPNGLARQQSAQAPRVVLLPPFYALNLDDGEVYDWNPSTNAVYRLQPPLKVPVAQCKTFPGDTDLYTRWVWTARVFEKHVLKHQGRGTSRLTPAVEESLAVAMQEHGMPPVAAENLIKSLTGARAMVTAKAGEIHRMLAKGETARVITMLEADPSLASSAGEDGDSLVLRAVAEGSSDVVAKCVALGADVKAPGWDGFAPIHIAVRDGHYEIARMLLEAGADPEVRTPFGEWTPSRFAQQARDPRMAGLLASFSRNAAARPSGPRASRERLPPTRSRN